MGSLYSSRFHVTVIIEDLEKIDGPTLATHDEND